MMDMLLLIKDEVGGIKMNWISVKDRLPESEKEVLIAAKSEYMGKVYWTITTAMYEDGAIHTEDSEWNWYDCTFKYDEETDDYIIDEGGWEYRHYNPEDVYNNPVDNFVLFWMPLPEPPEEGEEC